MATSAFEVSWSQCLLRELKQPVPSIPRIWCDNVLAIYLAANPIFHAHSKYLELDFHFICDQVHKKNFCVSYMLFRSAGQYTNQITVQELFSRFEVQTENCFSRQFMGE